MSISFLSAGWKRPQYVVLQADDALQNESLHPGLVGADLHIPSYHTGLLTADPHIPATHTNDRHTDTIRRLWAPANLFSAGAVVGAARTVVGNTPCWSLPDGNSEQLVCFLRPPVGSDQDTVTFRLYLGTANAAVGAGNALMVFEVTPYVKGDAITAIGGGVDNEVRIPVSGLGMVILEISPNLARTPIPVAPVGGYDMFSINVTRRGDLPLLDTYSAEIYFIGMECAFTFES